MAESNSFTPGGTSRKREHFPPKIQLSWSMFM